jgi:hypothetical protein
MQSEVKKAREEDALVKENPFAAFLASRSAAPANKSGPDQTWPTAASHDAHEALNRPFNSGLGSPPSPAGDHFASFLALGPAGDMSRSASSPSFRGNEQQLRNEVARAKRQLLEVTLQMESQALDPASKEEDVAQSLERLRRAHDYLSNPGGSQDSAANAKRPFSTMDRTATPMSPIRHMSNWEQTPAWSPISMNASMSNLQSSGGSFLPVIGNDTSRPRAFSQSSQISSMHATRHAKEEPLLSGWWSQTRCWNLAVSKRDMKARRQTLGLPGGTVVLGNGRMPNFSDSGRLAKGCFFAFQIDEVDEEHFPLDRLKDISLVIGVSRYPARHRSCERPMYGYEVPDAILLGYGGHLIDKGRWIKTSWNPKDLKVGDVVGLLVTEDGDFVVYINDKQVMRVKTSLSDPQPQSQDVKNPISSFAAKLDSVSTPSSDMAPQSRSASKSSKTPVKRVLFPMLDLHGRVSAVTLLPRKSPPNVPLTCRNKLPA